MKKSQSLAYMLSEGKDYERIITTLLVAAREAGTLTTALRKVKEITGHIADEELLMSLTSIPEFAFNYGSKATLNVLIEILPYSRVTGRNETGVIITDYQVKQINKYAKGYVVERVKGKAFVNVD